MLDVRAFAVGDLAVTEAMPYPDFITGSSGQWVEVRNTTQGTLDLGGLILEVGDAGFPIPVGVSVDAGAYLVFGQSSDRLANGDTPVDVEYGPDYWLQAPGRASINVGVQPLGELSWPEAQYLVSVIPLGWNQVVHAPGYSAPPCTRTYTYGNPSVTGSPGTAGEDCGAPYTMTSIPGAFVPAPTGSTIPTSNWTSTSSDSGYGQVALPVPFTYFGTTVTSSGFSADGLLTLGGTFTSSQTTNATGPSTSLPNGTVAPLWDDLVRSSSGSLSMWRQGDRTIFSWQGFNFYNTTSSLNFQVHLIDGGAIEFHYGELTGMAPRVTGSEATVWIESRSGDLVIPWSINTLDRVVPNSGIRFTPKQETP